MTDLEGLQLAYEAALYLGTDPRTQNGAVLVEDGILRLTSGNCFAEGVKDLPERWVSPAKYAYVEHAERNVIYKAAKYGIPTLGLTMFCPWFACPDCARAIIQAGIKEVVGHKLPQHTEAEAKHWHEKMRIADGMLYEAGVRFRRVEGKMKGIKIRFDGKEIEP